MSDRPSAMQILADLPDEEVVAMAMDVDREYDAIREVRNRVNAEVLRRFPDRTQWLCGEVLVEKVPVNGNYEWFPEELQKAFAGRITKAQWQDMVTEEEIPASIRRKVHTAAVLRIAKKVGVDLAGTFYRSERMPMLKYAPVIDDLQEKLEASVEAVKEAQGGIR